MSQKHVRLVTLFVTLTIVVVEVAVSFNSALLPNLKIDFQISESMAQFSIGIALFALGISGICYGAVSESVGRKPAIIGGLFFFCIGTIVATVAPNTFWLMTGRFIQGIGAGAGWIVGNACVKDVCTISEYPKVMNKMHAVAGIVPTIAPAVGAYVASFLGWRLTFSFLIFFGVALLINNVLRLPETNLNRPPLTLHSMKSAYASLMCNQLYWKYLTVKVLTVMLLFTDAANIPLIFVENLGVDPTYYGLYVLPVSLFYMLGSYTSSLWVNRFGVDKMIRLGCWCIFGSNFTLILLNILFDLGAIEIQAIKIFTQAGFGMIFGNATASLVSSAHKNSGAASAVMIALEMLFASFGIYGLSFFYDGTILPLSIFMSLIPLLCLALFFKKIPRI